MGMASITPNVVYSGCALFIWVLWFVLLPHLGLVGWLVGWTLGSWLVAVVVSSLGHVPLLACLALLSSQKQTILKETNILPI